MSGDAVVSTTEDEPQTYRDVSIWLGELERAELVEAREEIDDLLSELTP